MLPRRSRLVAKTPLTRRTPIRTSREKRTGRRDTGPDRATRELVLERDGYQCVVCGREIFGRQFSIHHRRNRGSGGSANPAINSPANLLTLCGSATTGCHGEWLPRRRSEAEDLGYIVRLNSREDPVEVPVHHFVLGLVYLDDAGGWQQVPRVDGAE